MKIVMMYQKRVKNENSLLDQMAERFVVIVLLFTKIANVNNSSVDPMSEAIAIRCFDLSEKSKK